MVSNVVMNPPPTSSAPPTLIGNKNTQIGVIVDRSISYDDDDEFSLGRDVTSIIMEEGGSEEQELPESSRGVLMRNGKVRRRLRWKPPGFRKSKNKKIQGDNSVISALTSRSTSTNRTNTTNKSFLSSFSKRSQQTFHTFHSTETPVATNKKNKPVAPHTISRPNYPDTFDVNQNNKRSTIADEGFHRVAAAAQNQKSLGSDGDQQPPQQQSQSQEQQLQNLENHGERVLFERSSSLPSRLKGTQQQQTAPQSPVPRRATTPDPSSSDQDERTFNPYGENSNRTNRKITASPTPSTDCRTTVSNQDTANSGTKKDKKLKRPPLFKRMNKNSNSKSPSSDRPYSPAATDSASLASTGNNSSSSQLGGVGAMGKNHTAPTVASSGSALSVAGTISFEREESLLPSLETDDYGEDRKVALLQAAGMVLEQAQCADASMEVRVAAGSSGRLITSNPAATSSTNHPISSSNSTSRGSSSMVRTPLPATSKDSSSVATPPTASSKQKPRGYNRPVDTMTFSSTESTGSGNLSRRHPGGVTVPVDTDNGGFLEAEHNLRAIHDMATEHLAHGEYEEAIEVFEEILRGQQARYGLNHYRVGTALHNLGIVYTKSGDFEKAIEVFDQAVQVRKDALLPNHPDVAVSLSQLGIAYLEAEFFEDALETFQEALQIRRTLLGPRHLKCSKLLNQLGCTLFSMDRFEKAKEAFSEALGIQRDSLGQISSEDEAQNATEAQSNALLLNMASTLCNIGAIKIRWRNFDEAEVHLEEALLLQQSVLGDDHPVVLSTMENIEFISRSRESPLSSMAKLLPQWPVMNQSAPPLPSPFISAGRGKEQLKNLRDSPSLACAGQEIPETDGVLNLNILTSSLSRFRCLVNTESALDEPAFPDMPGGCPVTLNEHYEESEKGHGDAALFANEIERSGTEASAESTGLFSI